MNGNENQDTLAVALNKQRIIAEYHRKFKTNAERGLIRLQHRKNTSVDTIPYKTRWLQLPTNDSLEFSPRISLKSCVDDSHLRAEKAL